MKIRYIFILTVAILVASCSGATESTVTGATESTVTGATESTVPPADGTTTSVPTGESLDDESDEEFDGRDRSFKTTFVYGVGRAPTTVDPAISIGSSTLAVTRAMYEKLVAFEGASTELTGVLATSWNVSDDGLEYTFELREGVKFHDGTDFDAEAAKFAFDRALALDGAISGQFSFIDSVEATAPLTLQIILSEPFTPFLNMLAVYGGIFVSPTCVRENEVDSDWAAEWMNLNGCGTGPYQFREWILEQHIILDRFEDYWRGWDTAGGEPADWQVDAGMQRNHLETIVFQMVREASSQRQLLEGGDIDYAEFLSFEDAVALQNVDGLAVSLPEPFSITWYLFLHTTRPPLSDPDVRHAISYAIDYQGIVDNVMLGSAAQAQGLFPSFIECFDPELPMHTYDPERARQLISDAGYEDGEITLTYLYREGEETQRIIGEQLQADFAQIGVNLDLVGEPSPQRVERWGNPDLAADLNMINVDPRYSHPDSYFRLFFHSDSIFPSGFNISYYQNAEVDELIDAGATESDPKSRCDAYKRALNILWEDAPAVWLMTQPEPLALRAWVKGFTFNASYTRQFDFYEVYKEDS